MRAWESSAAALGFQGLLWGAPSREREQSTRFLRAPSAEHVTKCKAKINGGRQVNTHSLTSLPGCRDRKGKQGTTFGNAVPFAARIRWKKQRVVLWEIVFLYTLFISLQDVQIYL